MSDLTLRICGDGDEVALVQLAERDSSVVPAGRLLAAETGGRLIAAISLESGDVIADPFLSTADAVDLLRRRATQIRRAHGPTGPPQLPRVWRGTSGAPASAET
ncbi:MAG TPA: hypothetical protein VH501_09650 [Solirubrobacterales bacterium]|jgi:hypothetical protein